MMKTIKFIPAVLGAAALSLFAGSAKAATIVDIAAVGSSAQFRVFTSAFLTQGYTNHYSLGSSNSFQIADPAANENAQIAIYWYRDPMSVYHIAVYYQVDSTVGVRAYFNSDKVTAPISGTGLAAGANLGVPFSGDVTPPDEVLQAVNNLTVNVGVTDITPEDARVATERTLSLGYSAANPVKSATNAASSAFPVRFSLSGRPFQLVPLGAVPIVVYANNSNSSTNINGFTLAGFLSGQFNRTSDLATTQGMAANPVHTYIAEPLSGTYSAIEYTNVEATAAIPFTAGKPSGFTAASGGQELSVSSNPLNEPANGAPNGNAGAGRIRVVGDVERINAANADPAASLGYAFWSGLNFRGQTNLHYLTVDGADPLQDNYTGGSLTNETVTFRNIVNGGYPLWSIVRVVETPNPSTDRDRIVQSAIVAQGGIDYVPFAGLRVFRSYHATPYTPGGFGAVANGNNGSPANGGDVGGAVLTVNNDQDAFNDFGGDLTSLRQ